MFTVIALAGELDVSTAPLVEHEVLGISQANPHLVFDMGGVTFLDSLGLRVLVKTLFHVRALGGTFALADLTGSPLRVLELTGLHTRIPLFATLASIFRLAVRVA